MAKCIKCGRQLPFLSLGKLRNVCQWCVQHEAMQNGKLDEHATQPVMPVPWAARRSSSPIGVTQAIVGICAAVFIGMALSTQGTSVMDPTSRQLIDWGANFAPLTLSGC
jgi:hypothetical protein